MMRASFENTQRGAVASECAGTGVNRGARADSRNNQSEDRDALGASARRRLFRECGTPQDAIRKMKVAKPIDIEFLQTERLQDFFAFHSRRPAHKVMNHRATTGACRTVNYFCGLSRNRNCERNEKLTGEMTRAGLAASQPKRNGPLSYVTYASSLVPRNGKGRGKQCNRPTGRRSIADALREYLARGMSYSEIAEAINAKFNTAYSRSAAIGRAKRMGLSGPDRPTDPPDALARRAAQTQCRTAAPDRASAMRPNSCGRRRCSNGRRPPKLRCVEIVPRHLSLVDLEPGDCRYPYGGDEEGEAITFCGPPAAGGSSYCVPHFHLTRGPGTSSERAAGTVLLRLVEAA